MASSIFALPAPNATLVDQLAPRSPLALPFYLVPDRPSLVPGVSDRYLAVGIPVAVYWLLGGLFFWLDHMRFAYFEARRIHESEEVERRNRVTMPQVRSPPPSCPPSIPRRRTGTGSVQCSWALRRDLLGRGRRASRGSIWACEARSLLSSDRFGRLPSLGRLRWPSTDASATAPLPQLLRAVLLQHSMQTLLGLMWLAPEAVIQSTQVSVDHGRVMAETYAPAVAKLAMVVLGPRNAVDVLSANGGAVGRALVEASYWWGYPVLQFAVAL